MSKFLKWIFVLIFIIMIGAFGFTFVVQEGSGAIVLRFGRIVSVHTQAGLNFRLPWPIDNIIVYDTRSQYMDSGYIETLTNDMINIILQTYIVWNIEDMQRFHTSTGDIAIANRHLNDLVANTKNGVLGNFLLSSMISTSEENIKLDQISQNIETIVANDAFNNFGIGIQSVRIKRIALPDANVQSIFNQMIADRQRYVSRYLAQGERDAAIILSEASVASAEIIAAGMQQAAEIDAQTERLVAELYAYAYNRNPELFRFLTTLIALENSVNEDTVMVMRADESPFAIIVD